MLRPPKMRVPKLAASRRAAKQVTRILTTSARMAGDVLQEGAKAGLRIGAALRASAAEPAGRRSGRFVEADGLRVHVIVRGRGRPVVLLHGNGTMAEDWAVSGLLDHLATRYRVIAIDRPGFGRTERPRHRLWTASAQAHLVHRVLERLNVERPVIVAHSWGTLVALALAVTGWRELRGLVLLSGSYFPERRADAALLTPLAIPGLGDAARRAVPDAVGRLLAPGVFRHVFRPQAVPARFTARFPVETAMSPEQLRASAEDTATMAAASALLAPHYPALTVPLALLTGDADAVVAADRHSRRLHALVPGSTLAILPGQGHMIHYFARARIGRAVDALMTPPPKISAKGPRARTRGASAGASRSGGG